MNHEALNLFVDVVNHGSFAAVARIRDLDPSSVSRGIGALEDALGFRLLQRTTRRLALTEAGQLYFDRVQPLLADLERARLEAQDVVTAPRGQLRVTASVTFGQKCLVPALPEFRALYPDLDVELVLTDASLDLVEDRIDLAIRLAPRADQGLVATRLMQTRYRVCASPAYLERHPPPATPAELAHHQCLLLPFSGYRSAWRFRRGTAPEETVAVSGPVVISNPMALGQAAVLGLGPALLADWQVADDLASGALVALLPEYDVTATEFDTAAWLLYVSRSYVPLKLRTCIDFLKGRFAGPT